MLGESLLELLSMAECASDEGEGNEAMEGGGVCGNKIMLCLRKVDRKTKLLK